METAEGLDAEASAALWNNLASGAESGWDFSSRWFANGQNLSTIRITELIPADLNAYLYQVSAQPSMRLVARQEHRCHLCHACAVQDHVPLSLQCFHAQHS